MAAQFNRLGTVKLTWRESRFILGYSKGTRLPDRVIKMLSVVNQNQAQKKGKRNYTLSPPPSWNNIPGEY